MSTAPVKRLQLRQYLLTLLRAADLVIALRQNRDPLRHAEVVKRPLEHVGFYHIHIRFRIRQALLHDGRNLRKPRQSRRVQPVVPRQHLVPARDRPHDGRDQYAVFPHALHHVIQPLPLVQSERVVTERPYAVHREHLHPLPRCRRLPARQQVHGVIEHFPLRRISFHPRSPPLPGSGMPRTPRCPAHTPQAAGCNRPTPPP